MRLRRAGGAGGGSARGERSDCAWPLKLRLAGDNGRAVTSPPAACTAHCTSHCTARCTGRLRSGTPNPNSGDARGSLQTRQGPAGHAWNNALGLWGPRVSP
jgi:hypothetical protein